MFELGKCSGLDRIAATSGLSAEGLHMALLAYSVSTVLHRICTLLLQLKAPYGGQALQQQPVSNLFSQQPEAERVEQY